MQSDMFPHVPTKAPRPYYIDQLDGGSVRMVMSMTIVMARMVSLIFLCLAQATHLVVVMRLNDARERDFFMPGAGDAPGRSESYRTAAAPGRLDSRGAHYYIDRLNVGGVLP